MVKEPYSWERFKRFYRRNDTLFMCGGLFVFAHIVWWEIQQNRSFVTSEDRVRKLGPFTIPYLDELYIFKRAKKSIQNIKESEK
jgi:hypothetical protein